MNPRGIKKRDTIIQLKKNGEKFFCNKVIILFIRARVFEAAYAVKKKIGNACLRNKLKRRMKEVIRLSNPINCSILIIPQKNLNFQECKILWNKFYGFYRHR